MSRARSRKSLTINALPMKRRERSALDTEHRTNMWRTAPSRGGADAVRNRCMARPLVSRPHNSADQINKLCHSGQYCGMATMNISLPDELKRHVEAQVRSGQFANASDYVRSLIRYDQRELDMIRAAVDLGDSSPDSRLPIDEIIESELADRLADAADAVRARRSRSSRDHPPCQAPLGNRAGPALRRRSAAKTGAAVRASGAGPRGRRDPPRPSALFLCQPQRILPRRPRPDQGGSHSPQADASGGTFVLILPRCRFPPICAPGVGRTALSPTRSGPEGSSRNEFKLRVVPAPTRLGPVPINCDSRDRSPCDREAAGGFRRRAASLVGHDASTSLPPRSLPRTEIRSVTAVAVYGYRPYN